MKSSTCKPREIAVRTHVDWVTVRKLPMEAKVFKGICIVKSPDSGHDMHKSKMVPDDVEKITSESHSPCALATVPAQQKEKT